MKNEPGMAYNTKKLNKIFAVLSAIFLITVIWLLLDDYLRPWKAIQIKALGIKKEKLAKTLADEEKNLDISKLETLKADAEQAEISLKENENKIQEFQEKLEAVTGKIQAEKIVNGEFNALVSETTFQYETALAHKDSNSAKLHKKLMKYKDSFAESKERLKAQVVISKNIHSELNSLQQEKIEVEKRRVALLGAKERLEQAIAKTNIMNPVWVLRNLPMIDFLDPTLKIEQVVLNNLVDDRYFQKVPKVDRCKTCHTFIDVEGYEDQENPFKTHPNLDLMVGMNSKHPYKDFGCTSCHGGEGHRVHDFQSIAHTPQNKKQEAEWAEKYHWHEPHKIMQPMLELQNTESQCLKCHKNVERVPGATVLNEGRDLIQNYGCYGCHKIDGWEHLEKPGPSLEKVSSKITKEFFKNWVWSPQSFNPNSRMPSFFNQSNNSDEASIAKNIAEVNAIAEVIWKKSKSYEPFMAYNAGDAEKGQTLIKEKGCIACHRVEGIEESLKVDSKKAPYLTGIGSKVNPDWLVSWLKKPSHYQKNTIMPSFRLSDLEVNDMAAYLLSLKNKKFEALKFEALDKEVRDHLLIDYLKAFETIEAAKAKLSKWSDEERTFELGHRSIGKYGCYSCHAIEGYEGRAPIGPDLSQLGSKPITQFGFGHEHIPHSRDAWIKNHLENPRRWDKGTEKSFSDLLRMPNFYLNNKEIDAITVALLGQVSEFIPAKGQKILNSDEFIIEQGQRVINKFNCMGCHKIDGIGGKILSVYEEGDINEGPPRLNGEGHRVHTDWLYSFLDNVHTLRPWLKVKMPSFELTSDEKNALVDYFRVKSKQKVFEDIPETISWEPGEREEAQKLFKSLDCTSCHTSGFNNEVPMAPDLHMTRRRLRSSWIKLWLSDPQKILEGTTMPSFFEGGVPQEAGFFGGDAKKQIDALTKYLIEIGHKEIKRN